MLIEIDRVCHVYEGPSSRRVLEDVSVRLEEPRIGVVGANGSGKSTFLRLLNGLVLPTSGRVLIGAPHVKGFHSGFDVANGGPATGRVPRAR